MDWDPGIYGENSFFTISERNLTPEEKEEVTEKNSSLRGDTKIIEKAEIVDHLALKSLKQIRQTIYIQYERDEKGAPKIQGDEIVYPPLFKLIGDKKLGVQPGFEALKNWKESDEKKLDRKGTSLNGKANAFMREKLTSLESNPFQEEFERRFPNQTFNDLDPELQDSILDDFREDVSLRFIIKEQLPKFTKIHYVKMDYQDPGLDGKARRPLYRLKAPQILGKLGKKIAQIKSAATPKELNLEAVTEALANDVYELLNIESQKLKILKTHYSDGTYKLLLSATEALGPKDEKFHLFMGQIKEGRLEKNKVTTPDGSIYFFNEEDLAKTKIKVLLVGDRDKIGGQGANIGFYIEQDTKKAHLMNIDPGKALERISKVSQNDRPKRKDFKHYGSYFFKKMLFEVKFFLAGKTDRLTTQDLYQDVSFDQPFHTLQDLISLGYKNLTVFDDTKLSDRIEGMREIINSWNKVEKIFDQYIEAFGEENPDELNFKEPLLEIKEKLKQRKEYFQEVLKERLELDKQELDFLDNLEKLTSPTINQIGKKRPIQFLHLQTLPKKRLFWSMIKNKDQDQSYHLSFQAKNKKEFKKIKNSLVQHRQTASSYPEIIFDEKMLKIQLLIKSTNDPISGKKIRSPKDKLMAFLSSSFLEKNIANFKKQPL